MYRPIVTCSLLFTLIATTCPKSIKIGTDEDVESLGTDRTVAASSDPPSFHDECEPESKANAKRSLLVLVPTTAEEEDAEVKSQKMKRCRASFQSETVGAPKAIEKDQTTLNSKNAGTLGNSERHAEYFVGRKPNIQLVSLKKPGTKHKLVAKTMEEAKNATFLDEDLINSLRRQLASHDPTVGAVHENLTKANVYEDGKFVCYCREKMDSSSKADTSGDMVSKPQPSVKKNKIKKKPDNKQISVDNKQRSKPVHGKQIHYAPRYIPNNVHPIFSQNEHGSIPYVPYVYHVDPRASENTGHQAIPTNINYPFNSAARKTDSIVGQRMPISQQRDLNKNQQTVGQAASPRNIIGNSLSQSSENTIPATTFKTSVQEDTSTGNERDSNLQSVHSSDKNHLPSLEGTETPAEISDGQAANPNTNARSSTGFGNEYANEYETTGSGTVDYSDIKEVTTAYFTSKAYDNETGHDESTGYSDFFISSTGSMNTDSKEDRNYNVNMQSRQNVPTGSPMPSERPMEIGTNMEAKELENERGPDEMNNGEESVVLGRNNPNWSKEESMNEDQGSNQDLESNAESTQENFGSKESSTKEEATTSISEDSVSSDDGDISEKFNNKDTRSNEKFSAEDYTTKLPETENNAGPLRNDYGRKNFVSDKAEEKMDGDENFINKDNERVGAEHVTTIRNENEDGSPSVESTLKSSRIDDAEGVKDPSNQALPFCDNRLLQKSIKAVINNFATGDSSEMDGNVNKETVGSTKGEDLLPEIVQVPNLKGILSMPAIENTVLDKVKDLLSRATGMDRKSLDSDWASNVIRDNLRNTISAAPSSKTELPPMTVEEHQFKNGKWMTNMVTLEPVGDETRLPTHLQRLHTNVKNLIRDPAISLQAAKNPAVQNMIIQSVRNTFKSENATNDETLDDSVVQSILNRELSIAEMENDGVTTEIDVIESTTFDVSNIDMNKFLDIARSEAGLNDKEESKLSSLEPTAYEKNKKDTSREEETISSTMEPSDKVIVGVTMNPEPSKETTVDSTAETTQDIVQFSEQNETPNDIKEFNTQELKTTTWNMEEFPEVSTYNSIPTETWPNDAATSGIQGKSSTMGKEDYALPEHNSATMNPIETADDTESTERLVGLEHESTTSQLYTDDTTPDIAYLGKITMKNENDTSDVQSLQNSELFYIGDGVKLPLEIRKLNDGSYALSISRKVCEHLLNKECPCCVPVKGNVVRTVKRSREERNADGTIGTKKNRRISKRESAKSILPNERRKYDSADDSLQIFSMPVETFARRYNLSLNLEKVQTPWNFDGKGKIDERSRDRGKNFENKEENADTDLYNLMPKELEKYRYERNVNENTNKQIEIITNVLHWLRDIILNTSTTR
ncbi:PREDICTED: uncharacterized protein LOC108549256 [Eufriesea mexicana]|uniref:uncharacterized protein LOC108549256 n=1 Tax=Eufriesea mexicana TaxID=516756 RepID=UPI00083C66D1|nr:PREDICTED: uncharacterized protein LOC108549256 [Eufriesea mexicana]